MSGYRRVPMQTKIPRTTCGSNRGLGRRGEAGAGDSADDGHHHLDNFKIGGIVVSTLELIKLSSPAADGLVRQDLLARRRRTFVDRALLDPAAAAVAGVSPASITNGACEIRRPAARR